MSFKADINREVSLNELKALQEEDQNELVSISKFQLPDHFFADYYMFPTTVQARYVVLQLSCGANVR